MNGTVNGTCLHNNFGHMLLLLKVLYQRLTATYKLVGNIDLQYDAISVVHCVSLCMALLMHFGHLTCVIAKCRQEILALSRFASVAIDYLQPITASGAATNDKPPMAIVEVG